ncbi:hypothetical protein M422DRAFT_251610 [Sphaerobolus stellatus SS14]|uniref:F-box domain-containing protein n=1 Tax=Sphaerobolus stellatus (strain SS14) TaxID=990650 RepID=A0A0C9W1Z7_SPHS4|nr:hypothetical protein M422DRAFT_251610 [Sphaerobolus stellatus SS14]
MPPTTPSTHSFEQLKNDRESRPSGEIRLLKEELDLFRELASRRQHAIDRCQDQFFSLQQQYKMLLKNVDKLQLGYPHTATLLAPIRRIPDKILRVILRDIYPRLKTARTVDQLEPSAIRSLWKKQSQLLDVCRCWTRIICVVSSLWSNIIIAPWFPHPLAMRCSEKCSSYRAKIPF